MQMSRDEILVRYRQAKDKSAQIGILAELNACGWEQIADILTAGGETFATKASKAPKPSKGRPGRYDGEELLALVEQGYSPQQIAQHLGCSLPALRQACGRRGISLAGAIGRPQPPAEKNGTSRTSQTSRTTQTSRTSPAPEQKKRTDTVAAASVPPVQTAAPKPKQEHCNTKTPAGQGLSMVDSLQVLLGYLQDWLGDEAVIECGARPGEAVVLLSVEGRGYRLALEAQHPGAELGASGGGEPWR